MLPLDLEQVSPKLVEDVFKIGEIALPSIQKQEQQLSVETDEGLKVGLELLRKTVSYLDEQRHSSFLQKVKKILLNLKRALFHSFSPKSSYEILGDQLIELVDLVRYLHKTGIHPGQFMEGNILDIEEVPLKARTIVQTKTRAFQTLTTEIKSTIYQILENRGNQPRDNCEEMLFVVRSIYAAFFYRAASTETKSIDLYGRPVRDIDGHIAHPSLSHGIFDVSEQHFLSTVVAHMSLSYQENYIKRQIEEVHGAKIGREIRLVFQRDCQGIFCKEEIETKIALLEEALVKQEQMIETRATEFCDRVLKNPMLKPILKNKISATCQVINTQLAQEIRSSADRINLFRNPESLKTDVLHTYPHRIANLTIKNPNTQLDNVNLFDHFRNVMSKRRESADAELSYLLKIIEHMGKLSGETIADIREGKKSVEVLPTIFIHPMVTGHPTIQKADIEQLLRDAVGDGSTKNPGSPMLTAVLINSLIQEDQRLKDTELEALLLKIESARPKSAKCENMRFARLREFFVDDLDGGQVLKEGMKKEWKFNRNIDLLRAALLGV